MPSDYSAREVAFYLAISHQVAEDIDTAVQSSWTYDPDDPEGGASTSSDGPDILHVLKWADVQRAKVVVERRRSVEALQARANGETNGEVAARIGVDGRTIRRHVKAALEDILAELGAAPEEPDKADRVAALLVEITRKARR